MKEDSSHGLHKAQVSFSTALISPATQPGFVAQGPRPASQYMPAPGTHHLRVILDNIVRLDKQDILRLQICVREFIVVQD